MTAETLIPVHHGARHHDPEAARKAVELFEQEEKREQERREAIRSRVYASGRMLLAVMFFVTGLDKLLNFNAESTQLFNLDVGDPSVVLGFSLAIELAGAVLLALGFKTRRVALGLAIYLGLVSLLAIAYFPPAFSKLFFIANVGVVGGLMFLIANGAGAISLDARTAMKEEIARNK